MKTFYASVVVKDRTDDITTVKSFIIKTDHKYEAADIARTKGLQFHQENYISDHNSILEIYIETLYATTSDARAD